MKMRKNARPAPLRREEMAGRVIAGQVSRAEAAASFCVTAKTAPKRVGRFRGLGPRRLCGPLLDAPPAAQAHAKACRRADRLLAAPSPGR